jgi:16S rRNA (uracil1498-N3)-methyltransferase
MELFYALPADCSTTTVVLRDEEFHHCSRVMRKQIGDELLVTDGAGSLFRTEISRIERDRVVGNIVEIMKNYNEAAPRLTLALGMVKNPSRMECAIEKCTELGVAGFIPLRTTRVIAHSAKITRWEKIVLAAMKQSCRTILPDISQIQSFREMLSASSHFEMKLIAHETEELSTTIPSVMRDKAGLTSAVICIGPEGGFTDEELQQARAAGFISVSLGRRRLRSETAAIAAVNLIISESNR